MFLSGTAEPPPPFPALVDGLLRRDSKGNLAAGAGLLSPHSEVSANGWEGPLDELTGGGFLMIAEGCDPSEMFDQPTLERLSLIDASYIGITSEMGEGQVRDLSGRIVDFMAEQGWKAMVVRPDYYIYGATANRSELPTLVADLLNDLEHAGLKTDRAKAHS